MFRLKSLIRLSILGASLGSLTAYANTPALINVTIPNLKPGFEFNIAALWLKPGASNLNYVIYNKELPTQSPSWYEQELSPGFDPAFELGIRYVFPCEEGKDAQLHWIHLNSNTSSSIATPSASYFLGPDYQIGPEGIPIRHASGNVKFKYNVVNLDVGQFVDFGQFVEMRFFGGLSGVSLEEDVTATYTGTTTPPFAGPFSTKQKVQSDFTGIGPRFGVLAEVNPLNCFGFMGQAAVSALIGHLDSKTDYVSSAQELFALYGQTTNYQTIKDQRVYQVIPGLDTKLGVNFKHAFSRDVFFTVTAGYQAAVYVNAISQYIPATLVAGQSIQTGGIFVATMSHTLSNYSVQGPFLDLALRFS